MRDFTSTLVMREAGDRLPILNIHHDRIDCEHGITIFIEPHIFRIRRNTQRATATSIDHLVSVVDSLYKQRIAA